MNEVTQTKPNTMRQLLARWAEAESGRCKLVENDYFKINLDADNWHLVYPDSLTSQDLMWIQWTVQQAIVERGWSFKVGHDSHYGFGYEAEVNASLIDDPKGQSYRSAAEALLSAYLAALKASQ